MFSTSINSQRSQTIWKRSRESKGFKGVSLLVRLTRIGLHVVSTSRTEPEVCTVMTTFGSFCNAQMVFTHFMSTYLSPIFNNTVIHASYLHAVSSPHLFIKHPTQLLSSILQPLQIHRTHHPLNPLLQPPQQILHPQPLKPHMTLHTRPRRMA